MDNDWIDTRIEAALKVSPVADTVVTVIRQRLQGPLCERALRGTEVSDLAKALLAAVHKPPSEGEL